MKRNTWLHNAALADVGFALLTSGLTEFAAAQDIPPKKEEPAQQKKPDYSPYPDQNFPNHVFWGVAHIHTGYSFDAGMFGVTLIPDDLFKVVRGGEVVVDNGVTSSRAGTAVRGPLK